jgi:phenylpyruvate tautomerase PptA (4-oxalocrotonate tautomerase family)
MPVVRIEAVAQPEDVDLERVLGALCTEIADLLGERPERTWATWKTVDHYAEGERGEIAQPHSTHPPLVTVTAFEGRPPEQIAAMLSLVADVLARELFLEPGNVFITYEEAHRGRLYTGGQVLE